MAERTKNKSKAKTKAQPVKDYCFPSEESYVILFETTQKLQPKAWSEVSKKNCLSSPWQVREFYSDEKSYSKRLAEFEITIPKFPI